MTNIISEVCEVIESCSTVFGMAYLNRIIVFPYGYVGIQAVRVMREVYHIEPAYIIDNNKCQYNKDVKPLDYLGEINTDEHLLLLASNNKEIWFSLREMARRYFPDERILLLPEMTDILKRAPATLLSTKIGKYSTGPICKNHHLIKEIGAFCSFAEGVEVVSNHPLDLITTHYMLYANQAIEGLEVPYENLHTQGYYIPGVKQRPLKERNRRISIGNDVWLGRNVTIVNGANIGNGVIAGAGAVITKDVPDYAIVVGVPAKILRFRYTDAQIAALNKIAWWNWDDDMIRERFDDFYKPVDVFISKYGV